MDALKVALVKALLRFFSALPLALARSLGRGAASVYWHIGGRARDVTERNIALAFPQLDAPDQDQLARRSLAATGELMAEMGRVWLRPWSMLVPRINVCGDELIADALSQGRGVLVLVPHFGNWEVVGLHLAQLGPVVSLYQPPALQGLGELISHARQSTGAKLVPTDRAGIGELLRALRAGQIAGLLPDQVPADPTAGENAPFMGVPCFTGTLATRLLQRTGALAVTGCAERVAGGFVLRYRAADRAIYSEEMPRALAALNGEVERCLQCCPEQYQWEYKRFRVRPRRGPGVYD